jgi:hypothetical protein
MLHTTPPDMGKNVFKKISKKTCTIFVPADAVELYRAVKELKGFQIEAMKELPLYPEKFPHTL